MSPSLAKMDVVLAIQEAAKTNKLNTDRVEITISVGDLYTIHAALDLAEAVQRFQK